MVRLRVLLFSTCTCVKSDRYVSLEDLGSQGFGDLLASIRNKNIPLDRMHFVVRKFCSFYSLSEFHVFGN